MMTRSILLNTDNQLPDPTTQHILSQTDLDLENCQEMFKGENGCDIVIIGERIHSTTNYMGSIINN